MKSSRALPDFVIESLTRDTRAVAANAMLETTTFVNRFGLVS